MHGADALLAILTFLLVVNIPTFIAAFLGVKCALYAQPSLKRFFLLRWVLPLLAGVVYMLAGIVSIITYDRRNPWFTEPFLSPWGCLGVICLLDFGLFFLWPVLKFRDYRRRKKHAATVAR